MTIFKWFKLLIIFSLFASIFLIWSLKDSLISGRTVRTKTREYFGNVNAIGFSPNVQATRIEQRGNDWNPNQSITNSRNIPESMISTRNEYLVHSAHTPIQEINEMNDKGTKIRPKQSIIHLTYDNPKAYIGPIVEGWPPWRDRDVSRYLNEPFTSIPTKSKLWNKTLVVIVPSRPSDILERTSCRRTWGRHANDNTAVLFLLGTQKNLKDEATGKIIKEKNIFGDMIQVDNLIEHYDNLTLKTLYAIKFFQETNFFQPKPPKYLMKMEGIGLL